MKREATRIHKCLICHRSYTNEGSLRAHTLKVGDVVPLSFDWLPFRDSGGRGLLSVEDSSHDLCIEMADVLLYVMVLLVIILVVTNSTAVHVRCQ